MIKGHKEVRKKEKERFFLLFLLDNGRILIWICEAQKPTDLTDPVSGFMNVHFCLGFRV
jgi:hypothetical protein